MTTEPVAIWQPDENKNPVNFTESAIAHFKKILAKQNANFLNITVKKSGCSGLSYVVEPMVEVKEGMQKYQIHELDIAIYEKDLPYFQGMTIDFVKEGLNSKVKFINPNEKGSCGCGESFTV